MNIGIIGSGEMGRCLATKFAKGGHTVTMANSRGPASLQEFTKGIGAIAATVEAAILHQQVIIVSIPTKNIPQLPIELFRQLPENVVVIDTGNYYPNLRDGAITAIDQTGIESWWVQQQLGVPVVKVFNAILATSLEALGRPKGDRNRIAIPVAGDHKKAKEVVFQLVDELGFDAFDVGPIVLSWKQQPGTPVYCRDIDLAELKKRADAMGTIWSDMRSQLTAQRKADEALMAADYPAYLRGLQ